MLPIRHLIPYRWARPLVTVCVLFLVSVAVPAPAQAAEAAPHLSQTCLTCHTGQDSTLATTPHQLPAGAPDGPGARIACTNCHAGDQRHWEGEPQEYAMVNPSRLTPAAEARVCSACHQSAHQQGMRERNAHASNDVNCSGCHSVHRSTHPPLLKAAESGLCLGCHASVAGQFAKPYRHPVNDQVLKCSDCHESMGATARGLERTRSEVCTKCHAEFAGPFPYEHPASQGFTTGEGGCLTCHDPHGSNLPRMLTQPYEPPHFQLCTQCHSVPRHNSNPMHGTRWSGMACANCHTDIHGSYVSRRFLSESLQGQGCINVGCHQL